MGEPQYQITIPGPIKGKARPRAARRGAFVQVYTPQETVNAEAHVKQCAYQQIGSPVLSGPIALDVSISTPVPASWSKRRRTAALIGAEMPTGKPDIDNVVKLLADALNGIAWRDDAQIVRLSVVKKYADAPQTVLTINKECQNG